MNYGLPYMGSKNGIAQWVVEHIPGADVFVDLFAGGCAVTHAALLSGRFGRIIANDISDAPQLFRDAVEGKFTDERRWISRDDFFRLKDSDPYVRYCWSFGNNGRDYLYSKEVEPWKRAVHYARVLGDCSVLESFGIDSDGSISDIRAHHEDYKKKYIAWYVKNIMLDESDYKKLLDDLTGNIRRESDKLRAYLVDGLKKSGKRACDVDRFLGTNGMAGHYFGRSQWEFPTQEVYEKLQVYIGYEVPYAEIYGLQSLMESLQSLESLQRLQSLQSLQSLESLQRLQSLQSLQRLESLQRLQRLQRLQSLQSLQRLQSLQSLQRLQSLQSLQSLQRLQRLEILRGDYRAVKIPAGSVVYCDIPYVGTKGYNGETFDHGAFYEWAEKQTATLIISEYTMPEDRFVRVASIDKRQALSGGSGKVVSEGLWMPLPAL